MTGDLAQWLEQIGLAEHAATFMAQGIGWDVIRELSEPDLKELGLSLGDRKRLLKALAEPAGGGTAAPVVDAVRPAPSRSPDSHVDEGERRQLTVMFIDLIDSSPLAERFDPEVMRQVLGQFHQACVSAIEAHDGHIAQYSGDGLLVYFGYPLAHEDDAVRAVSAGLGVVANLGLANERLDAEHKVRLHVRLGIETGLVVAGEVGAGSARDRQAIVGEAPIVAARLQTLAPPDTVVIGPATERLIQGSFVLESMGPRELKGVSEAIQVYRVLSRGDSVNSFDIREGRGLTPLIGRGAELEMLRQRWSQSCDGEMRCVLLTGEAGIGKSRTLRAFRDTLSGDAHEAITFHCTSYNRDSPFWPVLQRLQRAFELDAKTYTEADVDRLEAALGGFGIDTAEAAVVLSNLFGMPTTGRYPDTDTSSPAFKRRTLNVMVAMIEDMARRQPVLLVVEDAHWIDPSTLELMRLVLERLVAARLLVLVTARPEFKPGWSYPHLLQLNLDRLSRRERSEMIDRLTAGKPLPAIVLEQIVAKTDGVPLFVEELTKAVLQGDLLRDTGERYELKGALLSIAVPDTLQGSLLSRLDRLDPGVKELAQIAATIGREFERGLLSLVASKPERDLQGALDRLVAEDIILPAPGSAEEGGAYLFRHALIQDIAYNSLLLARRRQYHGLIADALEAHYPEVVERQPELVAQNLAASETPKRAIDYWRRAGERAMGQAAYQEAIAHATAGIRLAGPLSATDPDHATATLSLLMVRGRAEFNMGNRQAMDTFRQALDIARVEKRPSDFVRATLEFDYAATYLDNSGVESLAILDEALAMLGAGESVDRCRALSRLANTLHMTGSFERAAETAHQAVVLARRLGDEDSLIDALSCQLMLVGGRPLPLSDFADRRLLMEECRQVAERLGVPTKIGLVCSRTTCGYLEIGDYQGFEDSLERYREIVAITPEMVHTIAQVSSQAMGAILVGDFDLAERKAGESFELAESSDAGTSAGVYGMQMFTIRREQGRLGEVAPLIKRFVDENPENAAWRPGLMLIASDLGFDAQAHRTLETMAESGFAVPMDVKRLVTWTYIAEVAARLGEAPHAERIYALLLPYRDQAVTVPASTLCCGAAARYLGLLATALGDWPKAETHFEYALQMNEGMRAWPWLAHARHEFALMLVARDGKGDRARAADLLKSAAATANELKMFALEERIRGVKSPSRRKTPQVNRA